MRKTTIDQSRDWVKNLRKTSIIKLTEYNPKGKALKPKTLFVKHEQKRSRF